MRHTLVASGLVVLALTSCAKGPPTPRQDPFLAPKEQVAGKRVYALAEVTLPDGLPDPTVVQDKFRSLIEGKLRRGGHSVVLPTEYTKAWDDVVTEMGGLEDSVTGTREGSRTAIAMVRTLERLNAGFSLDAILIPSIEVVEASFQAGRATWDGATQSIKVGGTMKGFFAGSPEGKLGALSLVIAVYSGDGTELYRNAGGIEVLSKLSGSEFVLVPRQELFSDDERNQKAVDLALDPLLD